MLKIAVLSVLLGVCVASGGEGDGKGSSIELPVKSSHTTEEIKTPSKIEESSTKVDIESGVLPVYMLFKTQSSPLYVKQEHRGTKGSSQKSDSKDEPHTLVHEVTKPVIQELREIITPSRKVIQIIEKVLEERLTKVHKETGKQSSKDDDDDNEGKSRGGSEGKSQGGKLEDLYRD